MAACGQDIFNRFLNVYEQIKGNWSVMYWFMLATLLVKDVCVILTLVIIVIVKNRQPSEKCTQVGIRSFVRYNYYCSLSVYVVKSTVNHVKVYHLIIIAILHRIIFIRWTQRMMLSSVILHPLSGLISCPFYHWESSEADVKYHSMYMFSLLPNTGIDQEITQNSIFPI